MNIDGVLGCGAHYLFFLTADREGAVGVTWHQSAIGNFTGHGRLTFARHGSGPETLLGREVLPPRSKNHRSSSETVSTKPRGWFGNTRGVSPLSGSSSGLSAPSMSPGQPWAVGPARSGSQRPGRPDRAVPTAGMAPLSVEQTHPSGSSFTTLAFSGLNDGMWILRYLAFMSRPCCGHMALNLSPQDPNFARYE